MGLRRGILQASLVLALGVFGSADALAQSVTTRLVTAGGAATSATIQPGATSTVVTLTVSGDTKVEAHLVGYEGDLYGRTVRLCFLERLRDELRFESAEELMAQMQDDVERTVGIAGRANC